MKLIGVVIELDLGSGLEVVPFSRLGEAMSFRETTDGYGAAEWTFTLYEVNDSPIAASFLREMRAARLTLKWGEPGAVQSTELVEGFTRAVKWNYLTRSAQITCQDSSVKVATRRVQLSLATNPAGTTRESILGTVLGGFDITSEIDCPGGVRKAVTESGDKTVLEWVSLFVAPAGRRAYWRNGTLYVVSSGMGDPVATLKDHDIRDLAIEPAPTNAPNSVRFTALLIDDSVPEDGPSTTTEDEEGIYTPKVAIQRQNADGTIDDIEVSADPDSPISRKVTTKTVVDGIFGETLIEEWKWMAPFCPRSKQLPATYTEQPPVITHSGAVCYNFDDGDKWRIQDQETFQIWRRTFVEEFYSGGVHTGRRTTIRINHAHFYPAFGRVTNNVIPNDHYRPATGPGGFQWEWYECYLWQPDQSSERVSGPVQTFTSEESGYETPSLVIDDTFIRDATGDIVAIRRRLTFERTGCPDEVDTGGTAAGSSDTRRWRSGFPAWTIGGIYEIAGNLAAPRHNTFSSGDVEGEFVISYLPMTEATRTGHVQSVSGAGTPDTTNRPLGFESEMSLPSPGSSFVVDVQVPVEDRRGPFTNVVPVDVASESVVAANGEYPMTARNDYCETTDEEQVVARDLLRASLSPAIAVTLDPRGDIRAGDSIALGMQGNEVVLVRENAMEISLGEQLSATQTLTCMWWPEELD
jgi:hypothetical protein